MIKENATMVISQYDIDRLQEALNKEIAQRASLSGRPLGARRARCTTVCVPMYTFKGTEESELMVTHDLVAQYSHQAGA